MLPVDVLVTTQDRLAKQRSNPCSFVNTALELQEILYERAASLAGLVRKGRTGPGPMDQNDRRVFQRLGQPLCNETGI